MIAAAIDMSGSKIGGAAIDQNGNVLSKMYLSAQTNGKLIMEAYFHIVESMMREFEIDAIGVGAGGRIDEQTGEVLYAIDVYSDYIGLQIKRTLAERFGVPVAVDNDCKAALLGEKWKGAIREYDSVCGVIIGSGLGGGLLERGESLHGRRGGFAEIGHLILHPGGRKCLCGQQGCAEQYVAGMALVQVYNERQPGFPIRSGYDFFMLARSGDETARAVLSAFTEDLAIVAATCANLYDPGALLFGGGVLEFSELWWNDFQSRYRARACAHLAEIPLLRALLKGDAALLGAAAIAFAQVKR